jgi:hypothetical protein
MLRLGISRVSDWTGSAVDFVQQGLARYCRVNDLPAASRVFPEAYIRLLDELVELSEYERTQSEIVGPSTRMFITVNYDQAAMVQIGPTLTLLSSIHERLPAAFFVVFADNLWRWMSVYDFRTAENYADDQINFLDEEELKESFYLQVKRARPRCLHKLPPYSSAVRLLKNVLPELGDSRSAQLLQHCLAMHEHGMPYEHPWPYHLRDKVPEMDDYLENTDEPGPGALIVFDENDLVEACFTEQMQYLGQDHPLSASLMMLINLDQEAESLDNDVEASFVFVGAMVRSLASASLLIERIRGIYDEDLRQRGIKQELPAKPGAAGVRGE